MIDDLERRRGARVPANHQSSIINHQFPPIPLASTAAGNSETAV
jgi:hypothetical protein